MLRRKRSQARHSRSYPPEERGRRIVWRSVTIGVFLALIGGALWIAHLYRWPEPALIGLVSVPYWAAVTAVWRRWGPYMPGLHDG